LFRWCGINAVTGIFVGFQTEFRHSDADSCPSVRSNPCQQAKAVSGYVTNKQDGRTRTGTGGRTAEAKDGGHLVSSSHSEEKNSDRHKTAITEGAFIVLV